MEHKHHYYLLMTTMIIIEAEYKNNLWKDLKHRSLEMMPGPPITIDEIRKVKSN